MWAASSCKWWKLCGQLPHLSFNTNLSSADMALGIYVCFADIFLLNCLLWDSVNLLMKTTTTHISLFLPDKPSSHAGIILLVVNTCCMQAWATQACLVWPHCQLLNHLFVCKFALSFSLTLFNLEHLRHGVTNSRSLPQDYHSVQGEWEN